MKGTLRSFIALITTGVFLAAFAGPGSIGIIQSAGEFRLGSTAVFGNGTVFEGDQVETIGASSVVQLPGNAQLTLGPVSRAEIYHDHTVLENGTETVKAAQKHVVEAASLRISPANQDSVVLVEVAQPGLVAVSARTGAAVVRDQSGALLASVHPGLAFAFTPQGVATGAVTLTGTVRKAGNLYLLTDEATHTTVELRGANLARYVGKRVNVVGSNLPAAAPAGGATVVVSVNNVVVLTPAPTAAAGAGAAGLSTAAKAAIILGAAGAGGGIAYAAARNSSPQ